MDTEFIKLFAPVLIMVWIIWALKYKPTHSIIMVGLYFTSYAAFSQNFSLIYREIHQMIQIGLIILFVLKTIQKMKVPRINIFLGIFLLFIIVSLLFNPLDTYAKDDLINYLVIIFVVNYLFSGIITKNDLDITLNLIAIMSFLTATIGIIEFLINPGTRIEVFSSNPNYFALFLGVGFCIIFVNWIGWKRNISLSIIVISVILSGSRGVIFFIVFQFAWVAYYHHDYRKIILVLPSVFLVNYIFDIDLRLLDRETTQGSDIERVLYAEMAWHMANEHPLTGVGWGHFRTAFGAYSSHVGPVRTTSGSVVDMSKQNERVTHNDYVRILAELGWVGFLSTIFFTLYSMKILLNKNGFDLDYIISIWLGFIMFSLTHNNMNNAFFWFFILLPFFLHERTKSSKWSRER